MVFPLLSLSISQYSGVVGGGGILGRRYRTLSDPSRPVLIEGRSSRRNIPFNGTVSLRCPVVSTCC